MRRCHHCRCRRGARRRDVARGDRAEALELAPRALLVAGKAGDEHRQAAQRAAAAARAAFALAAADLGAQKVKEALARGQVVAAAAAAAVARILLLLLLLLRPRRRALLLAHPVLALVAARLRVGRRRLFGVGVAVALLVAVVVRRRGAARLAAD